MNRSKRKEAKLRTLPSSGQTSSWQKARIYHPDKSSLGQKMNGKACKWEDLMDVSFAEKAASRITAKDV